MDTGRSGHLQQQLFDNAHCWRRHTGLLEQVKHLVWQAGEHITARHDRRLQQDPQRREDTLDGAGSIQIDAARLHFEARNPYLGLNAARALHRAQHHADQPCPVQRQNAISSQPQRKGVSTVYGGCRSLTGWASTHSEGRMTSGWCTTSCRSVFKAAMMSVHTLEPSRASQACGQASMAAVSVHSSPAAGVLGLGRQASV